MCKKQAGLLPGLLDRQAYFDDGFPSMRNMFFL